MGSSAILPVSLVQTVHNSLLEKLQDTVCAALLLHDPAENILPVCKEGLKLREDNVILGFKQLQELGRLALVRKQLGKRVVNDNVNLGRVGASRAMALTARRARLAEEFGKHTLGTVVESEAKVVLLRVLMAGGVPFKKIGDWVGQ